MSVSLVKRECYDNPVNSAIELCNGFASLKSDHNVLIKPNLVMGADRRVMPPFGKVTTSRAVEQLIQALSDHGCRKISIGEGAIVLPEFGSNTAAALKFSGIDRIAQRYGVTLIDFEGSEHKKVEINGHTFKIAAPAMEKDFLINVPVLKTHNQAIVSLGLKNLKGCLKFSSKKMFHRRGPLLDLIGQLNLHITSDLVVIDGTYAMDRGPTLGMAHPMDVIIAGRDVLETDMVGAAVLGKDPEKIPMITTYRELTGRRLDLESIDIRGESIESVAADLPWESDHNQRFKGFGLTGIQVSSAPGDTSICSACYGNMAYANFMFSKDNAGAAFNNVEICIGKNSRATSEAKEVLLFGDCAIKNNSNDAQATQIPGCPPKVSQYYPLLVKKTLPTGRAIPLLCRRMIKNSASKLGLYRESSGLWDPYQSPKFNIKDY